MTNFGMKVLDSFRYMVDCCGREDFCGRRSGENCEFVVGEIEEILEKSLEEEAVFSVEDCFSIGDCETSIASSTFMINSLQGTHEIRASVCQK